MDQSKSSLEKRANTALDAFMALAPSTVMVTPAIFKSKTKGGMIRCISNNNKKKSFEVSNVDSVDKVYRILTKHMGLVSSRKLMRIYSFIFTSYLQWRNMNRKSVPKFVIV